MRISNWKIALYVLPLTFLAAAALPACGPAPGGGGGGKSAAITPGTMPDGAKWDGVYFNPLFGNLHVVETKSGTLAGRWKTADGSKWGEMNGQIKGNVAHYSWVEHKIGFVGPMAVSKGKGYFVYSRPPGEHVDDELKGEWGLSDSEVGNDWNCVKQRDVKADLNSIHGEEESTGPGKDWK
jgi:hypothetical protein